ncbi:hypothetical protein FBY58_0223 [Zymomonas mobilis]|uniref:Uncharacterized protein n=1 Tax=Zymomonas mobilis TaxID=542 RepID=A0A542VZC5_ZYMMB|nr:hypothetical protein FBY58_0223 [Zymomonas mobilis]
MKYGIFVTGDYDKLIPEDVLKIFEYKMSVFGDMG